MAAHVIQGPNLTQPHQESIPVKRCLNQFFTVFNGDEYHLSVQVGVVNGVSYIIVDDCLIQKFYYKLKNLGFQPLTLFGAMTETGQHFWYPIRYARYSRQRSLHRQLKRHLVRATTCWVKLQDGYEPGHRLIKTFEKLAQPKPGFTADEMLQVAFSDYCFIDSEQHPYLVNLKRPVYSMDDVEAVA